jgi:hypothetical protein
MLRDGRRCNANQITAPAQSLAAEAVLFANLEQEIEGRLSRSLGLILRELFFGRRLFWTFCPEIGCTRHAVHEGYGQKNRGGE